MRTAIIGLGSIGSAVARHLAAGGVELKVAERDRAKAEAFAAGLDGVQAVDVETAIRDSDVLVLAVWLDGVEELIRSHGRELSGKIVVDPTNPIAPDGKGGFVKTLPQEQSSGELLAGLLPEGARLVKAFGTLGAGSLADAAGRTPRSVLFYAADDDAAGRTVADLIKAAGFAPVKIGGLDQSIRIEVFGDLHESGKLGRVVTEEEAKGLVGPAG